MPPRRRRNQRGGSGRGGGGQRRGRWQEETGLQLWSASNSGAPDLYPWTWPLLMHFLDRPVQFIENPLLQFIENPPLQFPIENLPLQFTENPPLIEGLPCQSLPPSNQLSLCPQFPPRPLLLPTQGPLGTQCPWYPWSPLQAMVCWVSSVGLACC